MASATSRTRRNESTRRPYRDKIENQIRWGFHNRHILSYPLSAIPLLYNICSIKEIRVQTQISRMYRKPDSLFQSKVPFLLVEKQKTSYGWQSYDLYNKHLSTAAENLTSKTAKNSERGVGRKKNILEENYENNAIHISEKQSKNVFSSEINSCIPSSLRFFLQRVSFLEAANNRLMDWKPNS